MVRKVGTYFNECVPAEYKVKTKNTTVKQHNFGQGWKRSKTGTIRAASTRFQALISLFVEEFAAREKIKELHLIRAKQLLVRICPHIGKDN